MKAKALNIKNMKETLINMSNGDQAEFDKMWDLFYDMCTLGFITTDTWMKFHKQCSSWQIYENKVIDIKWTSDGDPIETIIHDYNSEEVYRA